MTLSVSGSVTPVDTDGDLVIDLLESGVWQGRIGANSNFGLFFGMSRSRL